MKDRKIETIDGRLERSLEGRDEFGDVAKECDKVDDHRDGPAHILFSGGYLE